MFRLGLLTATVCALAANVLGVAPDSFYLKDGDTVVFYGDSITDQRLYTTYTELYTVTRYPSLNVTFIHSGWAGDKVSGSVGGNIDVRLKRDVLAYQPTVFTVMLGMNDGGQGGHKPEMDDPFKAGYQHIVQTLRQQIPSLRITAIQPSPFDDVTRPITVEPDGYNAVLVNYGKWVAGYAKEAHLDVADFNTAIVAMLKAVDQADHNTALKIIPDRIHPSVAAHLIMSEQLLKTWNARALVSSLTINASGTPTVAHQEFVKATSLMKDTALRWTEIEESLPLPLQQLVEMDNNGPITLALKNSDIWNALNREDLRVNGLATGSYSLRIDGKEVGKFSNAQLGEGINLATYPTPMNRQGITVLGLTLQHNQIHFERWRMIQFPLQDKALPSLQNALSALDQLEADIVKQQREAARPVAHQFELTPGQ